MRKAFSLRWMLLASHVVVVLLSLAVAAVILTLLLRGYQERLVLARLSDVAIPTYYQAVDMA